MREVYCEDDGERFAPRVGCRCPVCYAARERAIDPALIELGWQHSYPAMPSHAQAVVYRVIATYLAGGIELPALYPEVVRALARLCDELADHVIQVATLSPRAPIVVKRREPLKPGR